MTKILIYHRSGGRWFTPSMINKYAELSGFSVTPYRQVKPNQLEPMSILEAKNANGIKWRLHDFTFFNIHKVKRDNPNLIKAIEDVIKDEYKSDWRDFSFKIVEIPDDVKWYIEEHEWDNGYYEEIVEEHRTWS